MDAKQKISATAAEVSDEVCTFIIEKANASIRSKGIFSIGVSGGSLSKTLCVGLPKHETDWTKWRMFFCDERHVAYDDPECTYKAYKEGLVDNGPLPAANIFPDNPNISVEEAAVAYEKTLRTVLQTGEGEVPQLDVLVLGMGPDGHTCSLFPGHPLLQVTDKCVAAISDSPKPPPQRITLTYPVLNKAHCAIFVSCGAGKAETIKRVLGGTEDPPLPAARVRPTSGELYWFMDEPAASLLQ